MLEHNHNSVEPQPHASNFVRELNISDAAATFVVPEHNPVGRGFWVAFAAHKSVEVAVEEHLNDVEFAAGEAAMEGTAVWVGVEDLEAVVGASGEASVVLVPRDGEQLEFWSLVMVLGGFVPAWMTLSTCAFLHFNMLDDGFLVNM